MDGRQVAAALVLGAKGVVIGTALTVAKESRLPPYKKQAILDAGSQAAAVPGTSSLLLACHAASSLCRKEYYTCAVWVLQSSTTRCLPAMHAGATVRSQVFDQVGPYGVWPHKGRLDVDGRALRNSFIDRVGASSLVKVNRRCHSP